MKQYLYLEQCSIKKTKVKLSATGRRYGANIIEGDLSNHMALVP